MSGNSQSTPEFDDFVNSGEIEVGSAVEAVEDDQDDKKPAKKGGSGKPPKEEKAPEKKAPAKADDEDEDEDETGETDEGDEDEDEGEDEKPKKSAKEHQIERLKREKRDLNRRLRALETGGLSPALAARLENLERGLPARNSNDTKPTEIPAPDPKDEKKYPLGHLDDRYIEDKIEWKANQIAAGQSEALLNRHQENEQTQAAAAAQQVLLDKVDEISAKGTELYEDFQEEVVETGMRGDWDLQQTTFEACADVENGAQILYELSQDPKEAKRVAKLTPIQQLKFVSERDAEIGAGKKPRTKPKAGEPPKNLPKGSNSKTQINPATDNLDDFEKAWKQDERKSR